MVRIVQVVMHLYTRRVIDLSREVLQVLQTGGVMVLLHTGAQLSCPTTEWEVAQVVEQVSQDLHMHQGKTSEEVWQGGMAG